MKTNKIFSIDQELAERLRKESNASSLVNQVLKDHFLKTDDPTALMSDDELQFEIGRADIQMKSLQDIDKLKTKIFKKVKK